MPGFERQHSEWWRLWEVFVRERLAETPDLPRENRGLIIGISAVFYAAKTAKCAETLMQQDDFCKALEDALAVQITELLALRRAEELLLEAHPEPSKAGAAGGGRVPKPHRRHHSARDTPPPTKSVLKWVTKIGAEIEATGSDAAAASGTKPTEEEQLANVVKQRKLDKKQTAKAYKDQEKAVANVSMVRILVQTTLHCLHRCQAQLESFGGASRHGGLLLTRQITCERPRGRLGPRIRLDCRGHELSKRRLGLEVASGAGVQKPRMRAPEVPPQVAQRTFKSQHNLLKNTTKNPNSTKLHSPNHT